MGNALCEFAAKLFATVADAGDIPIAENPAPDALYPSAWAMPCWQRLLKRKDVVIVPLEQCEYGQGA
eukprot:451680-Alexandrium_andersonii.AAC.1